MKTENVCERCGKQFNKTIARYQKKPRFCSMQCRGHTGFKPGGSFRTKDETEKQKFIRMKNNLEKHTIMQDGCWLWKGTIEKTGYARLSCRDIPARHAHTASFLIYN